MFVQDKQKPLLHGPSYIQFKQDVADGKYDGQRVGQAFYNASHLEKMVSLEDIVAKLYELDGEDAYKFIRENFQLSF